MSFTWWVEIPRDVFGVDTTVGIVSVTALVGAFVGGGAGYLIDKSHKAAEARQLLQASPEWANRYVTDKGPTFRIDTLDQDLRKVGIRLTSMSTPQPNPRWSLCASGNGPKTRPGVKKTCWCPASGPSSQNVEFCSIIGQIFPLIR